MRYPASEKLESEALSAIGPRTMDEPYRRGIASAG